MKILKDPDPFGLKGEGHTYYSTGTSGELRRYAYAFCHKISPQLKKQIRLIEEKYGRILPGRK